MAEHVTFTVLPTRHIYTKPAFLREISLVQSVHTSVTSCCYATIVRWEVISSPVSGDRLGKRVPAAAVTQAMGTRDVVHTVRAEEL
jgi:hypothetical protein